MYVPTPQKTIKVSASKVQQMRLRNLGSRFLTCEGELFLDRGSFSLFIYGAPYFYALLLNYTRLDMKYKV